jgi:signal transduction histidine kinase
MILKKFLFPIFFILLLICSCQKNFEVRNSFSDTHNYNDNLDKGFNYSVKQKYDSAFYYFEKANFMAQNRKQKTYALMMLADIQIINSDFNGAETTITQAYENCDTSEYLAYIYNTLGRIYQELKNYDESIKYYKKGYNSIISDVDRAIINNNIAVNYLDKNEYAKALEILSTIVENDSLKKDRANYAKVLDNLGYTYFKLKKSTIAEKKLKEALRIRDSLKNNSEIISSQMHMSEYFQKTNPKLAYQHAQMAYESAHKIKSIDDKLEALKFMIEASDANKTKELALKQIHLSDSITKVRQMAKNQFAKIKFDSKKAIKELERQKQLKEYFMLGIVLLFGLAVFIYYRIKISSRKKIEETAYRTETRIAKRLHDELANDVHNAIAFAETQNLENPVNKEALLENLDTIYSRTRNISGENRDIDTGEKYLEKLKAMMASYNAVDRNVIVNVNGFQHIKTSKEIKVALYRVFQELLVNMKKHSQCTLVGISIKTDKNEIQASYSDNGIGCGNMLNLRNGLQNAENRILSLKGTINFDTAPDKGFRVKIVIPK